MRLINWIWVMLLRVGEIFIFHFVFYREILCCIVFFKRITRYPCWTAIVSLLYPWLCKRRICLILIMLIGLLTINAQF